MSVDQDNFTKMSFVARFESQNSQMQSKKDAQSAERRKEDHKNDLGYSPSNRKITTNTSNSEIESIRISTVEDDDSDSDYKKDGSDGQFFRTESEIRNGKDS